MEAALIILEEMNKEDTHTPHTHTHTTYSLTDEPMHTHFPLCLTHQYIRSTVNLPHHIPDSSLPTIKLVDNRSLLIRFLLINILVLPYLVDKTISLSTRIPRVTRQSHYQQGSLGSLSTRIPRALTWRDPSDVQHVWRGQDRVSLFERSCLLKDSIMNVD